MWGRVLSAASTGITATLSNLRPKRPAQPLHLTAGRLARLAPSAAVLTVSETTILATLSHRPPQSSSPVTPLLIDFRTKAAAVGIIPGTWSRREQQPALQELLTSRLIDRTLRPVLSAPSLSLPPTQVTVSVLSSTRTPSAPVDALAVNAAAAAIAASPLSKSVPAVAASRVALVQGDLIPFPDDTQAATADLSVFAAVNATGRILSVSVEATRAGVEERLVVGALRAAVEAANDLIPVQEEFCEKARQMRAEEGESAFPREMPHPAQAEVEAGGGEVTAASMDEAAKDAVLEHALREYETAFLECRRQPGKAHRAVIVTRAQQAIIDAFPLLRMEDVLRVAQKAAKAAHGAVLLRDGLRMDGRRCDEVRLVRCETGLLPGNVHGSAIFERGDTQVLACATIGLKNQAVRTERYLEGGGEEKSFFVHYSFPPYSTGEYGRFGGASSRREVGHSSLVEKAIRPVLDFGKSMDETGATSLTQLGMKEGEDSYPYCFRLSAEVLASDGSSSMASVCAGSLALLNAGCPIKEPVAGVAMGLITGPRFAEGDDSDYAILTDILGAEDHFGEMDMKVTGTAAGVTACQLDVKPHVGLPLQIIEAALHDAKIARCSILESMEASGQGARKHMPEHAPRVTEVPVDVAVAVKTLMRDRASGLRDIEEQSGARLSLDGRRQIIRVEAGSKDSAETANALIRDAMGDLEVGTKLEAVVTEVQPSYAKLAIAEGNASGILHVSKMQVNPIGAADGASTGNSPDKLRFPDARRLLSKGDVVDVVVLECQRSKNILRFGLTSIQGKRIVGSLGDEIDAILSASQPTSG